MKARVLILSAGLCLNFHLHAQAEGEAGVEAKAPVSEAPVSEAPVSEAPVSEAPVSDGSVDMASVLRTWEKNKGEAQTALPRRWLFLQEQAGIYGSPSPLNIDKTSFENYGWFRLAESEAIRLFIQMNPQQKVEEIKPEDLLARLKRYASLAGADGVILKTAGKDSSWAVYQHKKVMGAPIASFAKGPESFREEQPAAWLVSQLEYDAMVVGTEGEYLILAKLKPLKRGAQGLILKNSVTNFVTDAEKEVGALLRIVFDSDDYALAKVSLSKSERPKVPLGSKVLFDQP